MDLSSAIHSLSEAENALGLLSCADIHTALKALDVALKDCGDISLIGRIHEGVGMPVCFAFVGPAGHVRVALHGVSKTLQASGADIHVSVIARPHAGLAQWLRANLD